MTLVCVHSAACRSTDEQTRESEGLEEVTEGSRTGASFQVTVVGRDGIQLELEGDPGAAQPAGFQIRTPETAAWSWQGVIPDEALMEELVRVRVVPSAAQEPARTAAEDWPLVSGSCRLDDGVLHFVPDFPLEPGLSYSVAFQAPGGSEWQETFRVPDVDRAPRTRVERVYPTVDVLPSNQLKFYLVFSEPMSQGIAYENIRLLDADGQPIEDAFLELGEELWDPTGTRFTLLFDPGRVKRELRPREELGAPLIAGREYRLVIDPGWLDARGAPLVEGHAKSFRAGAADRRLPDPARWLVERPRVGTRDALAVRFEEPLDFALLNRVVWVEDADGRSLPGRVQVVPGETGWLFHPQKRWRVGTYEVRFQTLLEDLAGNSVARPFEVDIVRPMERAADGGVRSLTFRIGPDL